MANKTVSRITGGNFSEAMRRLTRYSKDCDREFADRTAKLKGINPKLKGSQAYVEAQEDIVRNSQGNIVRLREQAKNDLIGIFDRIKTNVANRTTKPPTADQVNQLAILGTLENVSPIEVQEYAARMFDCPLAARRLAEIARKHHIMITQPDPESMHRVIEVLESQVAQYLQSYSPDGAMPFTIKRMHDQYLRSEGEQNAVGGAGSTEKAYRHFWDTVIGFGDPSWLDEEASRKPTSFFYFRNMDELLDYMHERTEGLGEKEAERVTNEILKACPPQYGAAYRHYQATGEKIELDDSNTPIKSF